MRPTANVGASIARPCPFICEKAFPGKRIAAPSRRATNGRPYTFNRPMGAPRMKIHFFKNNLANARIICYDSKLKTCSVPQGAAQFYKGSLFDENYYQAARGALLRRRIQ